MFGFQLSGSPDHAPALDKRERAIFLASPLRLVRGKSKYALEESVRSTG